jgi:hypothetical protein
MDNFMYCYDSLSVLTKLMWQVVLLIVAEKFSNINADIAVYFVWV